MIVAAIPLLMVISGAVCLFIGVYRINKAIAHLDALREVANK